MNIEEIREYCLSKKASTEGFPFDEDTLVIKVMGKMFAVIDLETANKLVLKCNADYALELREQYAAIEPAWHFNKKHWNQIFLNGDVVDSMIKHLIDHSYDEVVMKFTRKERMELENL
ncbi:MAG: MmcQ/YjbR family DNA-binding protein [Mediterranea massiliensis]|nr:MmcQ/YjbR family DNA-binding protein [Mediterranea massiliensis]